MESAHESESNEHWRKDANDSRSKDDAISPVISAQRSYHDSESDAEKDINFNEETSDSAENSKSSHSTSSSESSSDFFQIDTKIPQKSSTSGATNESTLQMQSPVQSPPIQVMEKPGGYDPNRIPDSVFGGSSSVMDWSVTSSESLFSLHLGNNSFSREQFLMMSGELNKSEELTKSNETVRPGRPPLSPLGKLQEEKAMDSDHKPEQTKAADDHETMENPPNLDVSDQFEEMETEVEVNGHSSMINRASDASGTSTQSFAFPILVDTTKSDFLKAPSLRQQSMKQAVYKESPQLKAQTKSSSSSWGCCCCCYSCCSLPQWSCPSYQHCWSWKWCKKWFCCSCC